VDGRIFSLGCFSFGYGREGEAFGRGFSVDPRDYSPNASPLRYGTINGYDTGSLTVTIRGH
jgi:hypothetical protein